MSILGIHQDHLDDQVEHRKACQYSELRSNYDVHIFTQKLIMTFRKKYCIITKLQLMTDVCNRHRILRSVVMLRFDCGCDMKSK
jgi:hypothetical protein